MLKEIKNMARPKGMLLPGMDTGNKKGPVKTIHENNWPPSPIISKNSFKVNPSLGI
jgi:hypothetical protein